MFFYFKHILFPPCSTPVQTILQTLGLHPLAPSLQNWCLKVPAPTPGSSGRCSEWCVRGGSAELLETQAWDRGSNNRAEELGLLGMVQLLISAGLKAPHAYPAWELPVYGISCEYKPNPEKTGICLPPCNSKSSWAGDSIHRCTFISQRRSQHLVLLQKQRGQDSWKERTTPSFIPSWLGTSLVED